MLVDDEPADTGVREAGELMDRLGIQPDQLIEGAYLDLMLAGERPPRRRQARRRVMLPAARVGRVHMKPSMLGLLIAAGAFGASTIYLAMQLQG